MRERAGVMRIMLRQVKRASLAILALGIPVTLAGCAQYQAAQHTERLPQTALVVPPPLATPEAPAPTPKAKPKSVTTKSTGAPAKAVSAKAPAAYRPAGAADVMGEAECTDVNACASVLKAMIADPGRAWMNQPASPAVLANGVRLFAYLSLREKLACPELAAAATEVEAAATAFRWGVAGMSTEQADRARALSAEVGQELHDEGVRRCALDGKRKATGLAEAGRMASRTARAGER
jgi:hypothetical protein